MNPEIKKKIQRLAGTRNDVDQAIAILEGLEKSDLLNHHVKVDIAIMLGQLDSVYTGLQKEINKLKGETDV